MRKICNNR